MNNETWLIACGTEIVQYLTERNGAFSWTWDPVSAMRLNRREDAENAVKLLGDGCHVVAYSSVEPSRSSRIKVKLSPDEVMSAQALRQLIHTHLTKQR